MRQMAGDRQHQIVMLRRHDLDQRAERLPERPHARDRRLVRPRRRGQDVPAVAEQGGEAGVGAGIFGAGDGMAGDEMHALRQVRRDVGDDSRFDRADVGDDGAGFQRRSERLRHGAISADRHAKDDEIGGGCRDRGRIDVAKLERLRPFEHLRIAVADDDFARRAGLAGGAGDRGADEADADQREPVEQGFGLAGERHHALRNWRKAATTPTLASSSPTLRRRQSESP